MDEGAELAAESFGTLLRRYRGARGLTQEELAERAGRHAQEISKLERDLIRTPRSTTAEFLADALKLDAAERAALAAAARSDAPSATRDRVAVSAPLQPAHASVAVAEPLIAADVQLPGRRRWPRGRWWLVPITLVSLAVGIGVVLVLTHVRSPAAASTSLPLCTSPGHPSSCWATIQDAGVLPGAPCPHQVPMFLEGSGHVCLDGHQLVEITCFYKGKPETDGDVFQDRVLREDGGRLHYVGHIPDRYVALGGSPSVAGIRTCGRSTPSPTPAH